MLCGSACNLFPISDSLIFTPNPGLHTPMSLYSPPDGLLFNQILSFRSVPLIPIPSVRAGGVIKLEVGVYSNGWVHAVVRDAILAQNIYCVKPNPKPNAHSGSWIRHGLGAQAPRSTQDYNLVNVISIWLLTWSLTYEMDSSILAAMSPLKVASTTCASFSIIPSTERTNKNNSLLVIASLRVFFLLDFPHRSNNLSIPSGFQVSASASPNLAPTIASV